MLTHPSLATSRIPPETIIICRFCSSFIEALLLDARYFGLGKIFRQIWPFPEAAAVGFYVMHPKCQVSCALEQPALFRKQTQLLVRGFENNAIYFSFLLAIFHSYIICVLQGASQARKQRTAGGTHLMYSEPRGQGSMPSSSGLVSWLWTCWVLWQQVCSKTRRTGEFKTHHSGEQSEFK
jgi:hypothetical protein